LARGIVILLDTHIWIWWVSADPQLPSATALSIAQSAKSGIGVSAISCWEVAKLVETGRLKLTDSTDNWLALALQPPVVLIPLTPAVSCESCRLPQPFHRDPADQIIVATSRIYNYPLVTMDRLIRAYSHVKLFP
jgi:PIN domain nuclease of toxin-antitoxin system